LNFKKLFEGVGSDIPEMGMVILLIGSKNV
jgi:hypothetical protein